jgi:hypothetical protein
MEVYNTLRIPYTELSKVSQSHIRDSYCNFKKDTHLPINICMSGEVLTGSFETKQAFAISEWGLSLEQVQTQEKLEIAMSEEWDQFVLDLIKEVHGEGELSVMHFESVVIDCCW